MSTNQYHLFKTWQAFIAASLLLVTITSQASQSSDAPADDWKAPPRAAQKPNPVPSDAAAIAAGKVIFTGNCMACQGPTGKGDGPAAVACNPRPKDLSDPKVASQADGELFWKITEGKMPMPTYEKLLSETDRWKVIDYIRTIASK